jgi:mannose-6-phosphate isomerase-like protein (cupin superfamily)
VNVRSTRASDIGRHAEVPVVERGRFRVGLIRLDEDMNLQIIKRDQLSPGRTKELVGADHGGAGVCLIFADNPPGGGPSVHKHPYEEVFITLEGRATFRVGDDEVVAGPDDIVIVPPDTPHAFTNSGDGPLRQINIHVSPTFSTEWL